MSSLPGMASAAICQTDMDCKGDRVCEGGECVYPPMRPAAQPSGGYTQPQPREAPPVTREERGSGLFAMWRKGIQAEVRAGLSVCVKDDEAECKDDGDFGLDPGGGLGAAFLIRFLPFLGVGVDFGYYMFNPEVDGEDEVDKLWARMLTLMLQVRGYLPFRYADVFFKFSAGYSSFKIGVEDGDDEYSLRLFAPFNVKLGMGGSFFLTRNEDLGDIAVGVDLDYLFTVPRELEECWRSECESQDIDSDDNVDLIDNFQLNVHFTWVFTIF